MHEKRGVIADENEEPVKTAADCGAAKPQPSCGDDLLSKMADEIPAPDRFPPKTGESRG